MVKRMFRKFSEPQSYENFIDFSRKISTFVAEKILVNHFE